jgi:hypothetical protein
MAKPDPVTLERIAAKPLAAALSLPPQKQPRQAVALVRRDDKWHVLLLGLDGCRVVTSESIEASYHRDLAEDRARKLLHLLERA